MNKKTISILTPVKNAEKFLLETYRSIVRQTFTNWEWIVIDDHSNTAVEKLLRFQDQRITVVKNEGCGIVEALNTGMKHVKGEYITRMDADDRMPSDKLKIFYETIHADAVDIVTGKVKYFSDQPVSKGYQHYENWLNKVAEQELFYSQIYRECTVCSSNWMMKTSLLNRIGGFMQLEYPEDYDLLFRWYQKNLNIKSVATITHFWREHPERTSRNHKHYSQEYFFKLKIKRFVELDYDQSAQLIVLGTHRKAKLTVAVLDQYQIPFLWISHQPEKYKAGIDGHEVLGAVPNSTKQKVQVLNAVMIEDDKILDYLQLSDESTIIYWL